MLTRRKFIQIGSLFLPAIAVFEVNPVFARWWAIQARRTTWQRWPETDEAGWGDAGTNIGLLTNISAGGNETSQGVVSGADLVYTQAGNIAGAVLSGGSYSRAFDGSDDYMTITATLSGILKSRNTWSVIIKFKAFVGSASDRVMDFYHANNRIRVINDDGSRHISVTVTAGTATTLDAAITDAVPAASDFYLWVCGDGTNTYAGWSLTRPTAHTSVSATQRVQAASFAQFDANGFSAGARFMTAYDGGTGCQQATVYYFIVSQSAIIPY